LNGQLVVAICPAQQVVSEIVAGICVVEGIRALCSTEQVLNLLVECPASTDLELVGALRPGDVVPNLVIVGLISPRPTRVRKIGSSHAAELNSRNATAIVSRKQFWDAGRAP